MKVGIIGMSNIKLMPYLERYITILRNQGIEFEVIYWDRHNLDEIVDYPTRKYSLKIKNQYNKIFKIPFLIRYRNFLKKTIKENKYDFIIVLTTMPGILIYNYLTKEYENKYIFDIRDYTYENIKIYYLLLRELMRKSRINILSSGGYNNFLPIKSEHIYHNVADRHYNYRKNINYRVYNKEKIRLNYIGYISYTDKCKKIINALSNDSRFEINFYGLGMNIEELKLQCKERSINNVYFHGEFDNKQKEDIYINTDIIFNAYGNENNTVKYALSNKLYEALYYRIPILVNTDTEMSKFAKDIAINIDYESDNLSDDIYYKYMNIIEKINTIETSNIMDDIIKNNNKVENQIKDILTSSLKE